MKINKLDEVHRIFTGFYDNWDEFAELDAEESNFITSSCALLNGARRKLREDPEMETETISDNRMVIIYPDKVIEIRPESVYRAKGTRDNKVIVENEALYFEPLSEKERKRIAFKRVSLPLYNNGDVRRADQRFMGYFVGIVNEAFMWNKRSKDELYRELVEKGINENKFLLNPIDKSLEHKIRRANAELSDSLHPAIISKLVTGSFFPVNYGGLYEKKH